MVDTSDEWIRSRSGIVERRIAGKEVNNSDMSVAAAKAAMKMAGVKPEDIDLVMVGTVTPDYRVPSSACIVQKKMGLINAAAMDIVAACAGFINGLSVADAFIRSGTYRTILVIGTEKLSSITNYKDRNTCVLFGDGSGAVVVEATEENRGILSTYLKSDGRYTELLWIPDGGSYHPIQDLKCTGKEEIYIKMNGSEIFKHAVRMMDEASQKALDLAGLKGEDVTMIVPHQANIRIIESLARRIGVSMDKVFVNIEKYGNTSSASVPIALNEALMAGRIKEGDIILVTAFGGGLTWASAVIKW
ncbi:3-oxoacyl-(acyl-carrier-protein) synthase III [Candidatus Zixiibacteriota bacterium]|nr:3-oxoacyl-(acyl-carrier-protein) synthase III [candidate division Zixibacteria bacterium]